MVVGHRRVSYVVSAFLKVKTIEASGDWGESKEIVKYEKWPSPFRALIDRNTTSNQKGSLQRATMKVRISRDIPVVPLGKTNFQGKVLVSLEDNAGFTMYEFYVKAGAEVTFNAFHEEHNHILLLC